MQTPPKTITLPLTSWQLDHVLDGLWEREAHLRRGGMDASDPRLVELIELRATVESRRRDLRREDA